MTISIVTSIILAIINALYAMYLNNKKEYSKANYSMIWTTLFIILILGELMSKKL